MRESVLRETIDDSVSVTEFVVEERTDNALRECPSDIADFLSDLVPKIRNLCIGLGFAHIHEDGGLTGNGVALQTKKRLEVSWGLFFDTVRDLLQANPHVPLLRWFRTLLVQQWIRPQVLRSRAVREYLSVCFRPVLPPLVEFGLWISSPPFALPADKLQLNRYQGCRTGHSALRRFFPSFLQSRRVCGSRFYTFSLSSPVNESSSSVSLVSLSRSRRHWSVRFFSHSGTPAM